jgi:hypothetical protein
MNGSLGLRTIASRSFVRTAASLALSAAALLATSVASAGLLASTITVGGPAGPVNYGTSVTFTATVTGLVPSGTVTFFDTTGPTTNRVTVALSVPPATSAIALPPTATSTAIATITLSSLTATTHTISATYSGDSQNTSSSTAPPPAAQYNLVVNPRATTTALTGSASPTSYGQQVTLTATVTGGLNASGTMTFKNNGLFLANVSVTVATGIATLVQYSLPAGTDVITATYSGDNNDLTSTSTSVTQVVTKVSTSIAIVAGPNPATVGQSVSMTATVTGALPLGGTIQLVDGTTVLSSQAPNSGGAVSFNVTTLAVGPHTLSAIYSGDISHSGSNALPVGLTVSKATTTTTLSVSPNPASSGQAVALTATVSSSLATGQVVFTDGPTTLGTVTLANGSARLGVSSFASGTHPITATYSGDSNYAGGISGATNLTVNQAPISIASSANPSTVGQSVTFTVTVTGNSPSGTVTFFDGANSLMDVQLASGVGAYSTSALTVGAHQISGRYNGDANNASGYSLALSQSVVAIAPATGYWWNPAEAGRGYVIEQQGNNLFMATFLYDASGRASWYGIGPGAIASSMYTGTLESFSGGQTLTGAYQAPTQGASGGAVTVTFTSASQGSITWPGGAVPIERFDFGPGGSETAQPAGTPQTGWWWAPTESGRGYAIEIQGNVLFLSGYMYDTQGNPIWYVSGPVALSNGAYQSTWQQYGNGETLTGTYQAPTVVNTDVGSVTIQFSSTSTGTLTFPDGRQVAIQRFQF